MSDIFISYSSADRPRAARMAQALAARGWSVWWDRTIPPGRQFDEVIEEALDAARCVVVLWSKSSAASSWVKTEAAEAMRRKALIPALIDEQVQIPLEFRRPQSADLTRWNGDASSPEFEQFCEAVASEVGRVSWDGNASQAFIQAGVADGNTPQMLGTRNLVAAVMRTGPSQIVLSTSVAIPGDSRTPGPHSHNVNLVFEPRPDGAWQFMRTCMAPDNRYGAQP